MIGLRQRVFGGLFWVAISSVSIQLTGFLSSVVLARLLTPVEFGLLDIAMVFISVSTILSEFGFGQALIQWQGDVQEATNTAFVFNVVLTILIALVLFGLSPLVAAFYRTPSATPVLRALTPMVILAGLATVPGSLLERELAFRRKTFAEVLPQVCFGLVAIGLALAGAGVWALVAGYLTMTLLRTALMWQRAHFRPGLTMNRTAARRLLSFGGYLVIISLLLFATSKVDVTYLGRIGDLTQVGLYGLAMTIVNVGVDFIASQVGRVTFPAFSRLQDDIGRVGRAYLRTVGYTSYFSIPIIFGIFGVAPCAIVSIYGAKWAGAITLTRILCLFGLFRALARLTGGIFTATGHPNVTLKVTLIRLGIFAVLLFTLGSLWQTTGVAWAASLSMVISGAWSIWLANRHLQIPSLQFLSAVWPQLAAGAIMCVVVSLADWLLPDSLVSLGLLVGLGGTLYAGLLFVLSAAAVRRDIGEIWRLMRERFEGSDPTPALDGG